MKVYIQTETHQNGVADRRPKVLVMETPGPVRNELERLAASLGTIVAIPPAAHEANLKALLARDLLAAGAQPGSTEDPGTTTVVVIRTPKDEAAADVWNLSYKVE